MSAAKQSLELELQVSVPVWAVAVTAGCTLNPEPSL